jgi:hypothetical protein
MPRHNHPSADMPTPMTLSAAQTLLLLKKKPVLATPSPELWGPPLPQPLTASEPGTQSSPLPLMGLPSPEMSSMLLCSASPLCLREPLAHRSLKTQATTSFTKPRGESATMSLSPRPKLIGFSTLSQSVRPVPHLDLSRLDRAMGPRRSWQEVVQRWRDQQLAHTQEVQRARRQRVVASQRSLATQARKNCSQLSTPSSD